MPQQKHNSKTSNNLDIIAVDKTKRHGQIFTPPYIVANILDFVGYNKDILHKHIIDNSCGDGAFICEIVRRYCDEFIKISQNLIRLKQELQEYVHGIEIDMIAYNNCINRLNDVCKWYGLENIAWDIQCADALLIVDYNGKMDFVVGNPPYVRVHNLADSYDVVKTFAFANGGMTDLYLVFFEIGFRMMSPKGKLCYITPSSWLNSLAAVNMRKYVKYNKKLVALIDFEHVQVFDKVTTYSLISLFDNANTADKISYYKYDYKTKVNVFIDTLPYKAICIGQNFYVSTLESLAILKEINSANVPKYVVVKNGFATLNDKIFIGDISFKEYVIPIIKASTGKWSKGFFPYDTNGNPISKIELFSITEISDYLNSNKIALLKGKSEEQVPDWYLYGRTQALKDVYLYKIAINTLVRNIESIKLNEVPVGSGVYSGLYILTDLSYRFIESIVKTQDFIDYVKILKQYKSGGYYTFNSRELEQYINYKITIKWNRIQMI